jgi:predicted nucleic acid-binding Zn ribbon protein
MDNTCIVCGEIIPEGRDICWACEHGYITNKENEEKKVEGEKWDLK